MTQITKKDGFVPGFLVVNLISIIVVFHISLTYKTATRGCWCWKFIGLQNNARNEIGNCYLNCNNGKCSFSLASSIHKTNMTKSNKKSTISISTRSASRVNRIVLLLFLI